MKVSTRRRIAAANWKMHKNPEETVLFISQLTSSIGSNTDREIVIFPTALCVTAAVKATRGSGIQVGGQNTYPAREGAFTGEISANMLKDAGATWVLVGHSERRHKVAHETDSDVLAKTRCALDAGLTPIVCVGEDDQEHQAGKANQILVEQFAGSIAGLSGDQFAKAVIAYEPVWAIGTGQTATPQIASEAHAIIRSEAAKHFGNDAAQAVRILYGGSVKPDNIAGLMAEAEIDGTLVGGASLEVAAFAEIIRAT